MNVIHVADDPSFEHVTEHIIYECLKDWGIVGKPEWHNLVLVVPRCGGESRLPLIPLSDANQIVSFA